MSSLILQRRSEVFKGMLDNNFMEKKDKTIKVKCKEIKDVKDLIYYLCVNELPENVNIFNIIQLAHFYQFNQLYSLCLSEMIRNISVDNYINTHKIFDKYEVKNGFATILLFGKKNIDKIKEQDGFEDLSFSTRVCLGGV